jgi:hypothetical protein
VQVGQSAADGRLDVGRRVGGRQANPVAAADQLHGHRRRHGGRAHPSLAHRQDDATAGLDISHQRSKSVREHLGWRRTHAAIVVCRMAEEK